MNPKAKNFAFWRSMSPVDAIRHAYQAAADYDDPALFISMKPLAVALAEAEVLMESGPQGKPLYGLPFAVKDNIDVSGLETTAACPAFTYRARESAFTVARLEAAGAICIGKTNLDQFATGLVGVRSPFGIPRNSMRDDLVPGGSSSGSAVAVGAGVAAFSLGTDTAGSGRVPAALNGITGLKPSLGLLSATGMVPACRTLDTISIFAADVAGAAEATAAAQGFDAADFLSRELPAAGLAPVPPHLNVGVPRKEQRLFFGDTQTEAAYEADLQRLAEFGATISEIDFGPFFAVAKLLYEGPWVAERYHAVKALIESDPDALHPVTRGIISNASKYDSVATFDALYKLAELKRAVQPVLGSIDCLAVPSIPTMYTVEQVLADPVQLNSNLGTYTNFVNLLDLAAISAPIGRRADTFPSSLTLIGKAGTDARLAGIADMLETGARREAAATLQPGQVAIAVVGAHMSGMPLNHELTARGGTFLEATATAPDYRLFALPGTTPPKPGLLRVAEGEGAAIGIELWALGVETFGSFVAAIPSPLGIGTIRLKDGAAAKGFLVEAEAVRDARDVSSYGSWRTFVASGD